MLYADFPCDQAGDDCTSEGANRVFRFEIIADLYTKGYGKYSILVDPCRVNLCLLKLSHLIGVVVQRIFREQEFFV